MTGGTESLTDSAFTLIINSIQSCGFQPGGPPVEMSAAVIARFATNGPDGPTGTLGKGVALLAC